MRKTLFLTLLLSMTVSAFAVASASASEGSAGRVPTVTRLVRMFSEMESNLVQAVEKRDKQAVSKMLSDDFEMRPGAIPGNPIPRAAWIQQSFADPKSSSTIEQMAVHDFGKAAVVSFLWKMQLEKSAGVHEIFVVDIWTQGPDEWKLTVRYAGPAGTVASPLPGVPMNVPAFEKKE